MTYKAYYQLEKTREDDPELNGRSAQRRVGVASTPRSTCQHTYGLAAKKSKSVIEHFRRHVIA